MTLQFVKCQFPGTKRAYTYSWDGEEPLAVGDQVVVETKNGKMVVTVVEVDLPEPTAFEVKAIVGRAEKVEDGEEARSA